MKEFYQSIANQYLTASTWKRIKLSPLQRVVFQECVPPEDARRIHDHRFQLMLEDIALREEEALKYGGGEEDWMIAAFHGMIYCAQKYGQLPDPTTLQDTQLPSHEVRMRIRARENRDAAAVYPLRKQGLSVNETAARLNLTEDAVIEAEQQLIRMYERIYRRTEIIRKGCPAADNAALTLLHLMAGHYRAFRRNDTGVTSYWFYRKDQLLGTASAYAMPDFPVVLRSNGLIFNSTFDPSQTIFPGLTRIIVDADDPSAVAARLTWLETGSHELQMHWTTGTVTVRIRSHGNLHGFYANNRLIAEVLPLPEKQHMGNRELAFCIQTHEALPDETALLLMSFPLLRFAE